MTFFPNDDISVLRGVGSKKADALRRMEINTLGDLLSFLPVDYREREGFVRFSETEEGAYALIKAVYTGEGVRGYGRAGKWTLTFFDGETAFPVVFYNQPYIKTSLKEGSEYRLYGRIYPGMKKGSKILIAPVIEREDKAQYLKSGVYPVYALPVKNGIKQKEFSAWISQALKETAITEDIPLKISLDYALMSAADSYKAVHEPESLKQARDGMRYFLMKKFMAFHYGISMSKSDREEKGRIMDPVYAGEFTASLPFELTGAQQRALSEILYDMSSGRRMNRLVQGDVGSGKTFVAVAAAYVAARNNVQAAICAPTEILARQHFEKYSRYFEHFGLKCTVLYGTMKKKEKDAALKHISSGEANIIFGTHALFSSGVEYKDLGFISIDEQHRYGVAQRALLENKGISPHMLVMSATPIPRTLALSIYKDLDISIIDEMPRGRKPVITFLFNSTQDAKAYSYVRQAAAKGLKTFIVCPAIDSEDMENVNEVYEGAVKALSPYKTAFMTGEMNEEKKKEVMSSFAEGDTAVLVSTTIIEVGIDVPKAVIMWVKGAERFGLSQLHQLRGRVGRGNDQGYCFLQTDSGKSEALTRLSVLKNTTDGFEIARRDMALRGSGDIFGYRQSGKSGDITEYAIQYPDLFMASREALEHLSEADDERSAALYDQIRKESRQYFSSITMN